MSATPSDRLSRLGHIVNEAGRLAQSIRPTMDRELKPDGSIVTTGDKEVELFLRRALPEFIPGTSFWGEEFGYEAPTAAGQWVVDPIDGTSNYSFGSPMWGVSVALIVGGQVELGAVFLADLDEMYLAERGKGAYLNDLPMPHVLPGSVQKYELVSYNENIGRLLDGTPIPGKMRCTGSFVVDGVFTAAQRLRGMICIRERLYDVAASVLIAAELGAEIQYLDGSPFLVDELQHGEQIAKPWMIFPRESGFRPL